MAYADAIRTPYALMNDVASLIEGTLVNYAVADHAFGGSPTSTSSLTYVTISNSSASISVASGQSVLAIAEVHVSLDTSGGTGYIIPQIARDGTPIGTNLAWYPPSIYLANGSLGGGVPTGNTTIFSWAAHGAATVITWTAVETPSVGSHTYSIQWCVSGASLTAYCEHVKLTVFTLQHT